MFPDPCRGGGDIKTKTYLLSVAVALAPFLFGVALGAGDEGDLKLAPVEL